MLPPELRLIGLTEIPELQKGDDLAQILLESLSRNSIALRPFDILVVAQKAVSKVAGRVRHLDRVKVKEPARSWAEKHGRDARIVQVVLDESRRIVRMDKGKLIVETHGGVICANAGVDASNARKGTVTLLPVDSDGEAAQLGELIHQRTGVRIGVIISDTFGRPWRVGQTNVAIGVAGVPSLIDYRGMKDASGRDMRATQIAVADELAGAAELLMGKISQVPAVLIRGLRLAADGSDAKDLIRPSQQDLFR